MTSVPDLCIGASARGPGGRGVAGNFHGEESPGSTKWRCRLTAGWS